MSRISKYNDRFLKICAIKKLILRVLGEVDNLPIWYVSNQVGFKTKCPRLLIVGGMHGEEVAGPLGILSFIDNFDPIQFSNINLSFIPLVNPVAYNTGFRYNGENERSNCGFYGAEETGDAPSKEGVILLKHSQLLKQSSRDGFLSLHEDKDECENFYIYTLDREDQRVAKILRDVGLSIFHKVIDGQVIYADPDANAKADCQIVAKEGIVTGMYDGSLEHWLFSEGAKVAITTETPGAGDLQKRLAASVTLIERFIKLCQ